MEHIVRLSGISLKNFKNVSSGDVDLSWNDESELKGSALMGIYGQNGSGKTAVIEAIGIVKRLFEGDTIGAVPHERRLDYVPYIKADCESCEIAVRFCVSWGDTLSDAIYTVEIARGKRNTPSGSVEVHPAIRRETLDVRFSGEAGARKLHRVMECGFSDKNVILPASRFREITGGSAEGKTELSANKAVCRELVKSFIFFEKNFSFFEKFDDTRSFTLITAIADYAHRNLFVVCDPFSSLVGMGALPFTFKTKTAAGSFPVSLLNTTIVPDNIFNILTASMKKINRVLEALIPGLSIEINDIAANRTSQQGFKGHEIELLSVRDGISVPLSGESRGIKKLVSILQLLITACNSPTVTVAVDELDAGVYEYLFGEIVQALQDHCQGQIIFTSHNLRPLEVLDRRYICFTTASPERRYIKLKNVRGSNNLRDLYLRSLKLGGLDEPLANDTDKYRLAFAMTQEDEADDEAK